jgi:hypothetical protein
MSTSLLRTPLLLLALLLPAAHLEAKSRPDTKSQRDTRELGPLQLTTVSVAPHLRKDGQLKRNFKKLLTRELARTDVTSRGKFTLSAALVELRSRPEGKKVATECVVNATVHQAPGGEIYAVLRGKGQVHSAADDPDARQLALETAVSGALNQLEAAVEAAP